MPRQDGFVDPRDALNNARVWIKSRCSESRSLTLFFDIFFDIAEKRSNQFLKIYESNIGKFFKINVSL